MCVQSAAAVEGEELEGLRRQLSELDARIVERTNAKIALERELNELLDDRRRCVCVCSGGVCARRQL
jgi:chromosome segregation ATPase